MYYRVNDNIALRGWKDVPFAYYVKGKHNARRLTSREFFCMLLCNGSTDLEPNDTLNRLERRGLVSPCEKDDAPSTWSVFRRCDNAHVPKMNLMITGRCNYNCPHCFNAADNAPLMTEWGLEDLVRLFDQAQACGVHSVMLTGGEPMLHPRFMDAVRGIHARGMFVDKINTNGYFISKEALDDLHALGCNPLMKISFDGLGHHDFMRGAPGAEARTLHAIELCIENGFRVSAQIQVNKVTAGSLDETLRCLDDLGVSSARLIRTSESDRWLANASGATLSIEEYYTTMLEACRRYSEQDHAMELSVWQYLSLFPKSKSYCLVPGRFADGAYRDEHPRCLGNREMIAITSAGEVVPCMQMSGYFAKRGISLGNVRERPLGDILASEAYHHVACDTAGDLRRRGGKCSACRHFERCAGGCPALAMILPGGERDEVDSIGADPSKCLFFEGGWQQRTKEALVGWRRI